MRASVDQDWDATLADRSRWCFEDRRLQLEATVIQISTGSTAAARRAVRLASYLDPVDTCLDPALLERLAPPPPHQRDDVRAVREVLRRVDALRHSGHPTQAGEVARDAVRRSETLQWPPLIANARFLEGRCDFEAGQYDRATSILTTAYFEALEAGSSEVAFRAARSLVNTTSRSGYYGQADVWSQHADFLASTIPDPAGLDAAEGHYLRAWVYLGLGDSNRAEDEARRSIELRSQALGAEHPITAAATRRLGRIYLAQGKAAHALPLFEDSLSVWRKTVPEEHPHVAGLTLLQAEALLQLGRVDEALPYAERAVASYEASMPAGSPSVIQSRKLLEEIRGKLRPPEVP